MLVGNAGVGKTILVSDKVAKLKEDYMVAKVPFNYYTTSAMLQRKNHSMLSWHIWSFARDSRLVYRCIANIIHNRWYKMNLGFVIMYHNYRTKEVFLLVNKRHVLQKSAANCHISKGI